MKNLLWTTGAVIVLASAVVACDKIKPPQPQLQKPPTATEQAVPQDGERGAFAQAAQKELDDLKTVIAEFKTKAEAANLEAKAKLKEEVEKLEVDLRETQARLTELKSATAESWSQVKGSFGNSLEKLKNGVETFRKKAT
jgi:glutamyl-tRNA reductase